MAVALNNKVRNLQHRSERLGESLESWRSKGYEAQGFRDVLAASAGIEEGKGVQEVRLVPTDRATLGPRVNACVDPRWSRRSTGSCPAHTLEPIINPDHYSLLLYIACLMLSELVLAGARVAVLCQGGGGGQLLHARTAGASWELAQAGEPHQHRQAHAAGGGGHGRVGHAQCGGPAAEPWSQDDRRGRR